ncbi:hypothetical protein RZS08_14935, partial [Arthrospira platensis SPKY1]|nr:hypothetical protein [Arthrospira platensis SPKY1]
CQHGEYRQQGLSLVGVEDQAQRAEREQGCRRAAGPAMEGFRSARGEEDRDRDERGTRQACCTMHAEEVARERGEYCCHPVVERRVGRQGLTCQHWEKCRLAVQDAEHGAEMTRIVTAPRVVNGEAYKPIVSGYWPVRGEIDPRPLMETFLLEQA